MKKSFLKGAGLIALASIVLASSGCKNNAGIGHDTVRTLGTPKVQGKAYPGVNYIYWDNVKNAINGYRIDVYNDDALAEEECLEVTSDTTFFVDNTITRNGVKRTYKVAAIGDANARALYYTESAAGSISLTSIVPPVYTSPLELSMYENGYDAKKKYTYKEDANTLSRKTITVEKGIFDKSISVSFPVKPYLSYKVYQYSEDYIDPVTGENEKLIGTYSDCSVKMNSVVTLVDEAVADDFEVYIEATAINSDFYQYTQTVYAANDSVNVLVNIIDNDADGVKDDAEIIVSTSNTEQTITSVKYAAGKTPGEALHGVANGTALTVTPGYKSYRFVVDNAVSVDAPFIVVSAVSSEEGRKDVTTYGGSMFRLSKNEFDVEIGNWECLDNDGLYNDAVIYIMNNGTEAVSLKIATGYSEKAAELMLDSSEATVLDSVSGYYFYEVPVKNIATGDYLAVQATCTKATTGYTTKAIYVTDEAAYDDNNKVTSKPKIKASIVALDDDGVENDVYITVEILKTQNLKELLYATSTTDEFDELADYRLVSAKAISINTTKTKKYETDESLIFTANVKDLPVGTYVCVLAATSETDKEDNDDVFAIEDPVSGEVIVMTKTDDPYLDYSNIYFECDSNDGKFNDIHSRKLEIGLKENQTIESVRYTIASSDAEAEEQLRAGSTIATYITLPIKFYLDTEVNAQKAELTKFYDVTLPSIYNIKYGYKPYYSVIVSEPGKLNTESTFTTSTYTKYSYTPEIVSYNVPEYSSLRPITKPSFVVDDGDNFEYVHLIIKENAVWDNTTLYTYKVERTFESYYNNGDPLWETIEENASVTYDSINMNGYYTFDKWYKDIPVGDYVYRLTKTRKETNETIVIDEAVEVVYNVAVPSITFDSLEYENLTLAATEYINPNYDDIEKYNYGISYVVDYYDSYNYYLTSISGNLSSWSWENVKDINGLATDYYVLKDAKLPSLKNNSAKSANVSVTITKTRKINDLMYDTDSTSLTLKWGLNISMGADTDVAIEDSWITGSGSTETVHLEVTDDFESYKLYVDSELVSTTTSNQLSFLTYSLTYGSHDILIIATDDLGMEYSTSLSYTK